MQKVNFRLKIYDLRDLFIGHNDAETIDLRLKVNGYSLSRMFLRYIRVEIGIRVSSLGLG